MTKETKQKHALNEVIDGLIKAGYSDDEAVALVAKLLEEEAEDFHLAKMLYLDDGDKKIH